MRMTGFLRSRAAALESWSRAEARAGSEPAEAHRGRRRDGCFPAEGSARYELRERIVARVAGGAARPGAALRQAGRTIAEGPPREKSNWRGAGEMHNLQARSYKLQDQEPATRNRALRPGLVRLGKGRLHARANERVPAAFADSICKCQGRCSLRRRALTRKMRIREDGGKRGADAWQPSVANL
jgi:hypothetical protein